MDHEITVAADGAYITLRILGPTGRHRMEQVVAAHVLGAQLGIRRFLVDLREAVNLESPVQDFQMANADFPAHPQIDRTARVACLVTPGDHSHDFLITVFRNAGSYLEKFENPAQAEAYLRR